ncbi:hypothetical protein ACIP5Y_24595 [Nocardia sp. NPDC088792]|uniref:hypothetical protein n=1 Tax=Nocardia sp. NPDC088792 TaxID=3364332 RepID=UPI00382729A0
MAENYRENFQVAPQYLNQAASLADVFQGAIHPTDLSFDVEKALQIARDIPQSSVLQAFDQLVFSQITQVSDMVDELTETVRTMSELAIGSPTFWAQVASAITDVFTNLYTQEDAIWIFWRRGASMSTSYDYNVLFAIQNEETGAAMAVLPITFEVSVELPKDEVMFITLNGSAQYEVRIKALTLVQTLQSG